MVANVFTGSARPEDDAEKISTPTFLETAPESFTPIQECSKGEVAAEIMALLTQAESVMDGAIDAEVVDRQAKVRALLHEAKELGDYLNV